MLLYLLQGKEIKLLYSILMIVLMLFATVNMLRSLNTESTFLRLAAVVASLATAALVMPWMVTAAGMLNNYPLEKKESVAQMVMYGGFLCSLLLAGLYLFRGVKEKGKQSFINAGLVLCSLVVAFIFYDNAAYNRGENGVMDVGLAKSMDRNIECGFGGIAFKYVANGESEWRCPKSIVLMQDSNKFFIPWPDYTQGRSEDLTRGIKRLTAKMNEASKRDGTVDIHQDQNGNVTFETDTNKK